MLFVLEEGLGETKRIMENRPSVTFLAKVDDTPKSTKTYVVTVS